MKLSGLIGLLAATASFAGCMSNDIPAVSLTRLDREVSEIANLSWPAKAVRIETLGQPLGDYLYMMGLTSTDIAGSVDTLVTSAAFSIFYPDVESRFMSGDSIERILGLLERNFSEIFDNSPRHLYFGVVSPYRQPIMFADSLVFVALNHYLGADYDGYAGMDEYLRNQKTSRHMPYDIAEAIVAVENPYVMSSEAEVIERMIYEGALSAAVMRLIPDASLAELLGWSDEQMSVVVANEGEIWKRMAASGLIYSTDPLDGDRLLSQSPSTAVISPELPGRVGRYIGYRIVESYLNSHRDMTVEQMLRPEFYSGRSRLIESGYSPIRAR